jgi:hypothetical protein
MNDMQKMDANQEKMEAWMDEMKAWRKETADYQATEACLEMRKPIQKSRRRNAGRGVCLPRKVSKLDTTDLEINPE